MAKYRVVLADDHILFREGIQQILEQRSDLEVVGTAGDGTDVLRLLRNTPCDLIVLDISMPTLRGIEAIPEIRRASPHARILMLTMHKDQEYLSQAIALGADGYVLKEDAKKDLFNAIDTVLCGKVYVSRIVADQLQTQWAKSLRGDTPSAPSLTLREREVLKLIAEGKSSSEIAGILYISPRTVDRHRANIKLKLGARKAADLVKYALQKGYI